MIKKSHYFSTLHNYNNRASNLNLGPSVITYNAANYFKSRKVWAVFLLLFLSLTVFQDYLYSILKNTGFYLSESLLYNVLWILNIPFIFIQLKILKRLNLKSKIPQFISIVISSAVLSLVQIVLSALFFVTVSTFVFSPPHRFEAMFNTYLSNHFYIVFIIYLIVPFIENTFRFVRRETADSSVKYLDKIKVKTGTKTVLIEANKICQISTDKPYTIIVTHDNTYIDDRSLKSFEALLNPDVFQRVHRSTILNLKYIIEMNSRKNGDFDAKISNGKMIRLSRHYRKNWERLLQ